MKSCSYSLLLLMLFCSSFMIYCHTLKFPRPATIRWSPHLQNTAIFIGSLTHELVRVNSKTGSLGSYTKPDGSGNLRLYYKVDVKDFEFVDQSSGSHSHKKLESIEANAGMQNNQNRLHLWQVFFANPNEWWDQRKRKLNPKQSDFKNKDTGEVLWLCNYDPP